MVAAGALRSSSCALWSMGAWRFRDGLAVEHWELSDGPVWDEFFLAGDPTSFTGSAQEFWTRGV